MRALGQALCDANTDAAHLSHCVFDGPAPLSQDVALSALRTWTVAALFHSLPDSEYHFKVLTFENLPWGFETGLSFDLGSVSGRLTSNRSMSELRVAILYFPTWIR